MRKVFLLSLVFSLITVNVFAQAAAGGKPEAGAKPAVEAKPAAGAKPAVDAGKKAPSGKLSLADLEGLTEEQILALLKSLELDDILYYLKMVVAGGSRELLVNMLGALNGYMASLDPQKAMEVAQKVVADNPELSFGMGKDGKPVVFVPAYNQQMNNLINETGQTQQEMNDDKTVVSGGGSL